jgi:hypothetical protein
MLEVISSTNNTLQVVKLENGKDSTYYGAYEDSGSRYGNLFAQGDTNLQTLVNGLSKTKVIPVADANRGLADQDINGATGAQNNGYAFTDVQVINGSGFQGNLKLNAILTEDVVGKYDDLGDFAYTLGDGSDVFDLAISAANFVAAGAVTQGGFVLKIGDDRDNDGDDTISTAIYTRTPNESNTAVSDGLDLATATATTPWYVNSKLANLTINAGDGADTVNTFGSGDWTVNLGAGNDTYYADNTGVGYQDRKATWVFNTANQASSYSNSGERKVDNLVSDGNTSHAYLHNNVKVRVTFKDVSAGNGTFESALFPISSLYGFNDRQINQAIIKAINDDPVLGKLLSAAEDKGNTLVVTALSDGMHEVGDLDVSFVMPSDEDLSAGLGKLKEAVKAGGPSSIKAFVEKVNAVVGSSTLAVDTWETTFTSAIWKTYHEKLVTDTTTGLNAAGASYDARFGTDFADDAISGTPSAHISWNTIDAGAGSDVIVLSTGGDSSDTIVWSGKSNETDTIVNFEQTGTSTEYKPAVVEVKLDNLEWTPALATDTLTLTLTATGGTITGSDIVRTASQILGKTWTSETLTMDQIGKAFAEKITTELGASNWTASYGDGKLVLTEGPAITDATPPAVTAVVIKSSTATNGGLATNHTTENISTDSVTNNTFTASTATSDSLVEVSETAPMALKLGIDKLDFSEYGAVAAYLFNTYVENGVSSAASAVAQGKAWLGTTPPAAALNNLANSDLVSTEYKGGAKYISLEQADITTDTTKKGLYEIKLWQDAQTGSAAGTADFDGATTKDTDLGVIGYVDFGQELGDAYFAANVTV